MEGVNVVLDSNDSKSWDVKIGPITVDLLSSISFLNDQNKEVLKQESIELLSYCVNPNEKSSFSNTGLAIGYVQSGKTLSFTTVLSLAADNNFSIAIVFSGTKNNLLSQTTTRLIKDLKLNGRNSTKLKLPIHPEKLQVLKWLRLKNKPLIILVILKHYTHINKLKDLLNSRELRQTLDDKSILIIDDEADQASLNTLARKNSKKPEWEDDEFSSTYKSILDLRSILNRHTYLQYTATPQATLLISLADLLSPNFHKVLTPGTNYTGGKEFFKKRSKQNIVIIPEQEVYHYKDNPLSECPKSLKIALQQFILASVIHLRIRIKEPPFTFMIHPDRQNIDCDLFYGWIKGLINDWAEILYYDSNDPDRNYLIIEFKNTYAEYSEFLDHAPSFEEIEKDLADLMLDMGYWLVVGKQAKTKFPEAVQEINWSEHATHVVVGADMFNRGFTVEGLAFTYMPRYSKGKTVADTMQQRARFFGYKADYIDLCRIFLPIDSIDEFSDYVDDEEFLREFLKDKSIQEFSRVLAQSERMNPTRNNILSSSLIKSKMEGARQFITYDEKLVVNNNKLIQKFSKSKKYELFNDYGTIQRNHGYTKFDIDKLIQFLVQLKFGLPSEVLRKIATLQYLRMLKDRQISYCYLFLMDFQAEEGQERERSIINNEKPYRLKRIFSGRSTKGSMTYPGDAKIAFDDSLNIQIYKIKLKGFRFNKAKIFWTLGFVYPENFFRTFIGTNT